MQLLGWGGHTAHHVAALQQTAAVIVATAIRKASAGTKPQVPTLLIANAWPTMCQKKAPEAWDRTFDNTKQQVLVVVATRLEQPSVV